MKEYTAEEKRIAKRNIIIAVLFIIAFTIACYLYFPKTYPSTDEYLNNSTNDVAEKVERAKRSAEALRYIENMDK